MAAAISLTTASVQPPFGEKETWMGGRDCGALGLAGGEERKGNQQCNNTQPSHWSSFLLCLPTDRAASHFLSEPQIIAVCSHFPNPSLNAFQGTFNIPYLVFQFSKPPFCP